MAIPEGWTQRTIGELAVLRRGLTWRKDQECESLVSDSLPVLRIPNVQQRLVLDDVLRVRGVTQTDRERYRVSVGSSLLVGSNGNPQRVGNCVFIDHGTEFLFASFLIAASVANTNIEPGYLFRILASRSVQDSISEAVQGSTGLKNINLTGLREIPVNLPPLPEQKKIAAILSSVDEVIAKTEAVIAQLQIVKKAMMEQLLTKGMPGRHTRFKQTEIGEIPEEWEVVEGSQMFELRGGYGPADVTFDPTGQFLFLKVDDFNNPLNARCLSTAALRFAHGPNPCIRTYPAGSLVFPKRGAAIFKNRVGILGCSATVDPNLMILLPKSNLHSYYFAQTLRRIGLASLSDNSGIPQLNNKHLYPLRFALPSFDEQREIASVVDAFDASIETEEVVRSELILLKQTLSSSLLSGEIRVIPEVAE